MTIARHSPIRDKDREEELLVRLIHEGRAHGLDAHFVTQVFHAVLDDSILLQQEYLQKLANAEDGAKLRAALEFLREVLPVGSTCDSKEVLAEAKKNGISRGTLFRAQSRLGILARKVAFESPTRWEWSHPGNDGSEVHP